MQKQYRILYDLWISFVGGYAGIPQDSRLIFDVLTQANALKIDGLFYTKKKFLNLRKELVSDDRQVINLSSSKFLYDALDDLHRVENSLLRKLQIYLTVEVSNTVLRQKYGLYPLDPAYRDMLWRTAFSKTLEPDSRQHVLDNDFYYSNISWRDMMFACYFNRKVHLNTSEYDYIIFPDVRPVTVSPNTKKIVRYHDSFAFLCPDFFQTYHSLIHMNSLKACKDDSYFVCNSGPTRETLLQIYPEIEHKTFVVPPTVRRYSKEKNWRAVKQICETRASKQISTQEKLSEIFTDQEQSFEYILALSTLEPRKNYINLIRAWENLFYQHNHKIKLMIVANPGWLSEDIERAMRPHIEMGNIIHLHNISSDELPYLFSHATFFAALSFIEGFGIPPIEAMQCECPVLTSDNATHRWSMGDAALYVEPYDVDSITQGMAQLVCHEGAKELRESLIQKGCERVKKYSAETIKAQWLSVLEMCK